MEANDIQKLETEIEKFQESVKAPLTQLSIVAITEIFDLIDNITIGLNQLKGEIENGGSGKR